MGQFGDKVGCHYCPRCKLTHYPHRVKAKLDTRKYSAGVEFTKAAIHKLAVRPRALHGEWNYELQPRNLTR